MNLGKNNGITLIKLIMIIALLIVIVMLLIVGIMCITNQNNKDLNNETSSKIEESGKNHHYQDELIGKYVNYRADEGSYKAETIYTGVDSTIGDQVFTTNPEMKWRIFNIDDENLYLISERSTYLYENNALTLSEALRL